MTNVHSECDWKKTTRTLATCRRPRHRTVTRHGSGTRGCSCRCRLQSAAYATQQALLVVRSTVGPGTYFSGGLKTRFCTRQLASAALLAHKVLSILAADCLWARWSTLPAPLQLSNAANQKRGSRVQAPAHCYSSPWPSSRRYNVPPCFRTARRRPEIHAALAADFCCGKGHD